MANWQNHYSGPSGRTRAVIADDAASSSPLQRILSEAPHMNLTGRIYDEERIKEARGGYADVFIGCQSVFAIAVLCARFGRWIEREMKIWSRLEHRNILPFLGYYMFEKDWPALISEWMDLGTLRNFLENHSKIDIVSLAYGIAEAIADRPFQLIYVLFSFQENILIGKNYQPLICDFGISRMLDPTQSGFISAIQTDYLRGTTQWMAPELFYSDEGAEATEAKHSKETDVWAYGMVLYEMISKKVPYAHLHRDAQVVVMIARGELPRLPKFQDVESHMRLPSDLYPQICLICKACWAKSPEKRSAMVEMLLYLAHVYTSQKTFQQQLNMALGHKK
ncbi:hypothetical protein ACEPAI_9054 [Sanghuangporus weigelae]